MNRAGLFLFATCLFACGDSGETPSTTSTSATTSVTSTGAGSGTTISSSSSSSSGTGGGGGAIDKAANCASTFGTELTDAYGRADGTVLAVVKPTDTQCAMFNGDHVVLEITMNGAVYRMVINVLSTVGDPNVRFLELDHPALGPAYAEGWHTGVTLDYVNDLGLHTTSPFVGYPMAELSDRIADDITIGQKVSVFSDSSGGASTHLIHRNHGGDDGAIVLDPDSATPRWLLFHFADQSF